jgi:hypothetical protein
LPPGLHQQPKREPIIAAIRQQVPFALKMRYRVTFRLYANWNKANGDPRELNTDNITKTLFDAMAEAWNFGKKGRGDCWLDRRYSVETYESENHRADVTLTPL